jgi:arginine decarboxylase
MIRRKNDGISGAFEKAAALFGSSVTVFSVAGATLALQTAVAAVIRRSASRVIVCDRRCHSSVINALALTGVDAVWFYGGDNDMVSRLCAEYNPAAVIITSPDYYGEMTDIAVLRSAVPGDIPLITDNSHGSHLAFYGDGLLHPYNQGSNLVVDSLHKTLPSMTGTALLHSDISFNTRELLSAMKLFASTSPSYILMSSICACLDYISRNHGEFDLLHDRVSDVKDSLGNMGFSIAKYNIQDPFRICIRDTNALKLYRYLAENGLVCEFADTRNLILIPSLLHTQNDFDVLIRLCEKFQPSAPSDKPDFNKRIPIRAMSLREAVFSPSEYLPVEECAGRISASPVTPYPPGIPVIMPGEMVDSEIIEILHNHNITHMDIII